MNPDVIALGLLWYVVFLLSTTCHEAAHALVAKWGGDLTTFHGGQVTLNPPPHIRRTPFGMVIFPLITYAMNGWMMGWASAPYDRIGAASIRGKRRRWLWPDQRLTLRWRFWRALRLKLACGRSCLCRTDDFSFSSLVGVGSPGVTEGLARFLSLLFSAQYFVGNLQPASGASARWLHGSPAVSFG